MPAYTFQHIKDGSDVDGETDAAYVIPSVVGADSGSYRVRVTNPTSGRVRTFGPKDITVIPLADSLLLETGDQLLLETGDALLIDA